MQRERNLASFWIELDEASFPQHRTFAPARQSGLPVRRLLVLGQLRPLLLLPPALFCGFGR